MTPPACRVPGCAGELHENYHKRHRVCPIHMAAEVVVVSGVPCRFCQKVGPGSGLVHPAAPTRCLDAHTTSGAWHWATCSVPRWSRCTCSMGRGAPAARP